MVMDFTGAKLEENLVMYLAIWFLKFRYDSFYSLIALYFDFSV